MRPLLALIRCAEPDALRVLASLGGAAGLLSVAQPPGCLVLRWRDDESYRAWRLRCPVDLEESVCEEQAAPEAAVSPLEAELSRQLNALVVERRELSARLAAAKPAAAAVSAALSGGVLLACCRCGRVRGRDGRWVDLLALLARHGLSVSHGLCDGCES